MKRINKTSYEKILYACIWFSFMGILMALLIDASFGTKLCDGNYMFANLAIVFIAVIILVKESKDNIINRTPIKDSYAEYLNERIKSETKDSEQEFMNLLKSYISEEEMQESDELIRKGAEEIAELVDKFISDKLKEEAKKDIFALMYKNNQEITEYFKISKYQSKASFYLSIVSCICGLGLVSASIVLVIKNGEAMVIGITSLSAAIVEVISGTTLWIHNKSLTQLNHYYESLHENEKFLSAIKLVDNITKEKRDEVYIEVIKKQIEKI